MNLYKLSRRSLGFYWRTNLGVLLAVVVAASVLTGALAVGDSVRQSLKMMVTVRLGTTQFALVSQDRFFRAKLADKLASELNTKVVPVLQLRGLIASSDGTRRANKIQVLGVDERFFLLNPPVNWVANHLEGIILNEPLAKKLNAGIGDEVVLRMEKPSLMPREAPLSTDSDLSLAFRLKASAIADQSQFGLFNLQANQAAPLNVFVSIQWLQEKLDHPAQANMLLVAEGTAKNISVEKANQAISKCWQLADTGLELREIGDKLEIRSSQIFIDESLAETAMNIDNESVGILTYFVNELRCGDRTTPYSMVTAIDSSPIQTDIQDDEILINQWLADDLGVKVGDMIELTYFVVEPMRKLNEQKSSFQVRQILPMEGAALDKDLMPDFPGLADVENCRDWEPGIPIDLDKIRKSDEDYWYQYRGTPKAFVTLKAGQAMWANRYGDLTAIRYQSDGISKEDLARKILSGIDPASIGLFFQPVRESGVKASSEATDFGQLFLGFSFFLIIAALVLMALIFVFGVESRSEQTGLLLAVGFTPKLVKRLLLIEGGILAILGVIFGTTAGLFYTKVMIYGLATVWRTAVSGSTIHFYIKLTTLLWGALASVFISIISIWITLRKQVSRPARELLAGNVQWQFFTSKTNPPINWGAKYLGLCVAVVAAFAAIVLLIFLGTGDSAAVSAAFFGAGALLLIAGLGLSQALLKMTAGSWRKTLASLAGLGLRNSTRRSGRSLAVIGLLACGIFLVIAVGANKQDPLAHADKRDSGTGGFALFGESTIGILNDLNSKSWRQSVGLEGNFEDVRVIPLRVHDGDDASCLNLNRAQKPRLLGIQPNELQTRNAFKFTKTIGGADAKDGWNLLNMDCGENVVPAIGDYPTITWALGKSIGDEIEYTDQSGRIFRIKLVGMIKSSILQGSLIIAEDEFIRRFQSEDGYRMFLVDAPTTNLDAVAEKLTFALRDFGIEFTPATNRLAAFSAVENTYLSIFQMLGGLGLIIGSVGLGLVVLRNMLDRRGEFAMLRAVGFDKVTLKRMVFYEHGGLLLSGLVCGVVAALVAIGPVLKSPGAEVPYLSLMLTIVAIGISGLVWIRLATTFALAGKLLDALRNE